MLLSTNNSSGNGVRLRPKSRQSGNFEEVEGVGPSIHSSVATIYGNGVFVE